LTAGALDAVVITYNASTGINGSSSGAAVQVSTVVPVVTASLIASTAKLPANTTSLVINGSGFSTTAAHNVVTFSNGATGKVTGATATTLTVTKLSGLIAGGLTVTVTSNGVSSGTAVQVATIVPVVTVSTTDLAANATSLIINGSGFSTTAASNVVTFPDGGTGIVTSATATQLTVTGLSNLTAGDLTVLVTSNGVSNGTVVQVATVLPLA